MAKQETFKNVRKNRFTQVSNEMAWDSKLTLQAKGLLLIFLSNSEDWDLHMKEIIQRSKNGRDAHYKIVDELIEHGYFARVEIRKERNRIDEMVYIFSDNKQDVAEALEDYKNKSNVYINADRKKASKKKQEEVISPLPENQDTENQDTESQYPENQDGNNNTISKNIKNNNTKSNNTNLSEEIAALDIPVTIQKVLAEHVEEIDRLIRKNKMSLLDVQVKFNTSGLNANDFALKVHDVLTNGIKSNFKNCLHIAIENMIKDTNNKKAVQAKQPVRKEIVPDFLKAQKEAAATTEEQPGEDQEQFDNDFLQMMAELYREGNKSVAENEGLMNQLLQSGLLEDSEIKEL
ncbi:hypothetical protein CCZ20_24480 [Priestia aryabhattai]|uniref:hypothetical protein n=1 Tax=Priestia aryabhattai TaxID=412384 RepID=UPI000B50CCF2|nr:hypothetical protein [Priestia aryabhattai]OVE34811.1 hypothetical protein CCZ20_24480 [Priestia aryabhattai]